MTTGKTITLTEDEAQAILNCLNLLSDEISYQLNDSPFEHDPAGIAEWEAADAMNDIATGILAAQLWPEIYGTKEASDGGL